MNDRKQFYGGCWFCLLGVLTLWSLCIRDAASPSQVVATLSITILYFLFAMWIWIRSPAKSSVHGVLPRVMAFIGTYMPWTISFFPQTDYTSLNILSPFLVICGMALAMLALLHLRTAFSLVPQARHLVRSGPYRWLRHPLYVAEEIAIIGVLLQHLSPATVLIVAAHIGVQIGRMYFEEQLLSEIFPAYDLTGPRWRLVPFVY